MDVIPGAALNQYLITDTEEKLVCIYVCNGKKERGYRVGMEDRLTAFNTTSVTVLAHVFDFKMCAFCLLLAVTLLLHRIFHSYSPQIDSL